jgi:uncharacterized membrane protein YtjA (UPF0391 family)
MFVTAVAFMLGTILASLFGFPVLVGYSVGIARVLAYIFLAMSAATFLTGLVRTSRST